MLLFSPEAFSQWRNPASPSPACSPLLRPVFAFCSVSRGIKFLCPLPCHLWELTSPFLAVLPLILPACLLAPECGKGFLPLHTDLSSSRSSSVYFWEPASPHISLTCAWHLLLQTDFPPLHPMLSPGSGRTQGRVSVARQ